VKYRAVRILRLAGEPLTSLDAISQPWILNHIISMCLRKEKPTILIGIVMIHSKIFMI
jgi:hypothetical protein